MCQCLLMSAQINLNKIDFMMKSVKVFPHCCSLIVDNFLFENLTPGAKLYHMASGHMGQTR